MKFDLVLDHFDKVTRNGNGYKARCPAHDDREPSLSLSKGDNGGTVAYCHGGCTLEDIVAAAGLTVADLFDDDTHPRQFEEARYRYDDTDGRHLYDVVRYGPRKDFRPFLPGARYAGLRDVTRVLYRLPAVVKALGDGEPVVVVEGEKDADRLAAVGFLGATTTPNGAKSFPKCDTSILGDGAGVVIIPDNDHAGHNYARSITERHPAARVLILDGLKPGGDVSDWFDQGGTADELRRLITDADDELPDTEHGPPAVTPRRYIEKGTGLLARQLRDAVTDQLILARGLGSSLWRFNGGVWTPDGDDAVEASVAALMGDDYRTSYAQNVRAQLLADPPRRLEDTPVPEYINFTNGLLNWRTLELEPHDPDVPTVNQIPHKWNPHADAPRADRFMSEVFHDDAAHLGYELIGYALYDGNPFQIAGLLLGTGANGKSEYLHLVGHVLGASNVASVPLHTLTGNRFAAADLYGKLANLAGDLPSTHVEDTARFKAITGNDYVYAERKFRDAFQFIPRALPLFSANDVPGSSDASYAYLRRWVTPEFPNRFGPDDEPGLRDTLEAEAEGILANAVRALQVVMERGHLADPESSRRQFAAFTRHIDPVRSFIDDCIEVVIGGRERRSDVYDAYRTWCRDEGNHPLSARRFTPRLRALLEESGAYIEELKVSGVREWEGFELTVTIDRTDPRNLGLSERRRP